MQFATHDISLEQPRVMGILNVTPDSFSDGGQFYRRGRLDINLACDAAMRMVESGAIFIDIGGESTRPGAHAVTVQQELDRVLPVVEALAQQSSCVISVDSSKPEVFQHAARAGAGLLNDVRALTEPSALAAAAEVALPVCLMHMQGQPQTMQDHPRYQDIVEDVCQFLRNRIEACVAAGIDRSRLLVDPGFGFGKTLEHNLELLNRLGELRALAVPILVGVSRKSMIGAVLNKPPERRLAGGLALAVLAVDKGASVIRTHDVEATVDALKMVRAVSQSSE